MNDLATLYFVLSKVQMPFLDENIFKFVLSIGDSIITLRSPRFKKGAFSMPYKTKKEVSVKSDSNHTYRSLKIQIFIIDQINDITTSGLIKLKPEDYLNKSPINLDPHTITIENIDVTITFGLSLIKGNAAPPSNFDEFPSSTKEESIEQRKRKTPVVNPLKEETNDNNDVELELLEDDFEEEETKEKANEQEAKKSEQNDDSRRHRRHRSEQNSDHRHESNNNHSSSGSGEDDSGRKHRRKRQSEQNDQNSNRESDQNNHSHRKRSHESRSESEKDGSNEGERRHRRKRDGSDNQQPTEKSDGESGRKHKRKSKPSEE